MEKEEKDLLWLQCTRWFAALSEDDYTKMVITLLTIVTNVLTNFKETSQYREIRSKAATLKIAGVKECLRFLNFTLQPKDEDEFVYRLDVPLLPDAIKKQFLWLQYAQSLLEQLEPYRPPEMTITFKFPNKEMKAGFARSDRLEDVWILARSWFIPDQRASIVVDFGRLKIPYPERTDRTLCQLALPPSFAVVVTNPSSTLSLPTPPPPSTFMTEVELRREQRRREKEISKKKKAEEEARQFQLRQFHDDRAIRKDKAPVLHADKPVLHDNSPATLAAMRYERQLQQLIVQDEEGKVLDPNAARRTEAEKIRKHEEWLTRLIHSTRNLELDG